MKTLAELVAWLQATKGTERWRAVAVAGGVSYDTVARIARGSMRQPSVLVVERICNGIAETEVRGIHANESRRNSPTAQSPKVVQAA